MGACIAQVVASRGAIVSLADVNEAGLQKTLASLPGHKKHIYTLVDVRSAAAIDSWIERTVKELGRLDCAANFAGVLAWEHLSKIQDETEANWDFHMNVNGKGVFLCMGAEVRKMTAGGSIVSCTVLFYFSLAETDATNTGECVQCSRPDGLPDHGTLCRQQARRHRHDKDRCKGKPAYQVQLRGSRGH